ncbi:hypothetical protein [Pelomonas sp. SE-A7]|uniref:hypothetical protein n=1 Tax=Pelomonas sp. SE-A7 TaxID=3054953 RepID=UPI00259CD0E0|nr:hypothetical protein [Pelomonas sp. SE-A7]MDM4764965.1 hypothetical protein [Pelomonas sp. SE-A7]
MHCLQALSRAGLFSRALAMIGLSLALQPMPPQANAAGSAAAMASATVVEPVSVSGQLGAVLSISELLAANQGPAGPATGSVLVRLVNLAPAVLAGPVSSGGEGGQTLSTLLNLPGGAGGEGGVVAALSRLIEPLSGGLLQGELATAVSLSPPPGAKKDDHVAIVVAFN